jgi:hypothetical protein
MSESLDLEIFILLDGKEAARFHRITQVATGKRGMICNLCTNTEQFVPKDFRTRFAIAPV